MAFLLGICLLLACADKKKTEEIPYYNSPDFTPIFIADEGVVAQKIPHQIADFCFIDQNGVKVSQKNIEGKIHVANFVFTSCGSICPVMTKNLKILSNQFKNDKKVIILSYSVTPWIDDVKRLAAYTKANKISNPNWHFLTGSKAAIYTLARKSYFAEEDLGFTKDSTDFLHTEHILLVDNNKRIRGVYNGTLQLEVEQLIKDIKSLETKN